MIKSFRHKGLKLFYETESKKGIQAKHADRLREQLTALRTAEILADLDLPGYRLHELKGSEKGVWSITVQANWRLTFTFSDGDVYVLDYRDYH